MYEMTTFEVALIKRRETVLGRTFFSRISRENKGNDHEYHPL
jgi:hypothetical protein